MVSLMSPHRSSQTVDRSCFSDSSLALCSYFGLVRYFARMCDSARLCRVFSFFAVMCLLLTALACQQPSQTNHTGQNPASSAPSAATAPAASAIHDLSKDEAAGGHTLKKHVGRTDNQLRQRLRHERNISAASTYTDRAAAEMVVGAMLLQEQAKIRRWLNSTGGHPNLVLDYDGNPAHPIGKTLRRGEDQSQPCSHALAVLKWTGPNDYYVLTTYPECRP